MTKKEDQQTSSKSGHSGDWRALASIDHWLPALIIFCFIGLVLIQEAPFSGKQFKDPGDGDCNYYLEQAVHPFSVRVNPFAFRSLTPLIVNLIKKNSGGLLGWDGAWYSFTFALVYGCGLVFFRFCRRVMGLSPSTACLATLILLGNWVYCRFQMQIPFFPDPLNNFLWMLAFYLLFTERWGWFHVTIAVGMLNKEVILFLAPLCPLFIYLKTGRLFSLPVIRQAAVVAGICGCYWAYRYGLGHYWGMPEYRLLSTNDSGIESTMLIGLNFQKSIWHLFNTFGFLWITFFFMLYELHAAHGWRNRYLLASIVVFFICMFSRLFSTDVSRIFVMMSPLVVGLSVAYLSSIFADRRFAALVVVLVVVIAGNQGWLKDKNALIMLNLVTTALIFRYSKTLSRQDVPA